MGALQLLQAAAAGGQLFGVQLRVAARQHDRLAALRQRLIGQGRPALHVHPMAGEQFRRLGVAEMKGGIAGDGDAGTGLFGRLGWSIRMRGLLRVGSRCREQGPELLQVEVPFRQIGPGSLPFR